ncbi:MAG TPA: SOS response-associated peptidase family protein [Acidobacteriota bacterium]|nr:SOS response-associated peptidase family protein [Acidobacteriota bacterium]
MISDTGLWETWIPKEADAELLRTCTIITCEPNPLISRFHHRMLVMMTGDRESRLAALLVSRAHAFLFFKVIKYSITES